MINSEAIQQRWRWVILSDDSQVRCSRRQNWDSRHHHRWLIVARRRADGSWPVVVRSTSPYTNLKELHDRHPHECCLDENGKLGQEICFIDGRYISRPACPELEEEEKVQEYMHSLWEKHQKQFRDMELQ